MICLDANVLLEIIEKRPRSAGCERYLTNNEDKAISTLTLDLVMYFVERDKIEWRPVRTFLDSFTWLPSIDADAQWAFEHFGGQDLEDALQVACARREGCKKFATLDQSLAKKYANHIAVDLLT